VSDGLRKSKPSEWPDRLSGWTLPPPNARTVRDALARLKLSRPKAEHFGGCLGMARRLVDSILRTSPNCDVPDPYEKHPCYYAARAGTEVNEIGMAARRQVLSYFQKTGIAAKQHGRHGVTKTP
jgi:hypothetical protein